MSGKTMSDWRTSAAPQGARRHPWSTGHQLSCYPTIRGGKECQKHSKAAFTEEPMELEELHSPLKNVDPLLSVV